MEKKVIQIYDTSLRDGMQGLEINYTLEDKLNITQKLDDFKIDYIEGGFPLANAKEAEYFNRVKKLNLKHSKISAFGSTRKPNGNTENDPQLNALLEAETQVVTIVAKSSSAHVTEVLKTDKDENLRMTFESVQYLKKQGREVILDLEHFFDGYKLDPDHAKAVLKAGTEAGADILVICDTNGGILPHEISYIFDELQQLPLAPIGVHFHNDCELAVANSLLGVEKGAIQIQGTINGWGERVGNTNLISIIPNLLTKDTRYTANCVSELSHLTTLARYVSDIANIVLDTRQAFVGNAAFSHKAGQHADVIIKNPLLMEHMKPETVGNERHILLSELAGKSTIVEKLKKYGDYNKNDVIVENLISVLKEKENMGYEFEAAEASFELEVLKELNQFTPLATLKHYHIEQLKTQELTTKTACTVYLYWKDLEIMGSAVGVGPVDTLDKAIRNALEEVYPNITNIHLTDYKVRVLNPENHTSSKVRVLIRTTHTTQDWNTIGVHENILEASWQALMDSYNYYYNILEENNK